MFHHKGLLKGFYKTFFLLVVLFIQLYIHVESQSIPSDFFLDVSGISISAISKYVCTLEAVPSVEVGGRAVCWGMGESENLKPPDDHLFIQIITTNKFACGITVEQRAFCWGQHYGGETMEIEGLYTQLTGSDMFACGVLVDGNINCWPGDLTSTPVPPEKGKYDFVQVSCSSSHCAGLDKNAHVISWDFKGIHGENDYMMESNPRSLRPPLVEISVKEGPDDFYIDDEEDEEAKVEEEEEKVIRHMLFKQISVSHGYTCGILYEDASLYCWGNIFGIRVPFVKQGPFRQVSTGKYGVCTIQDETNALECNGVITKFFKPKDIEYDEISVGEHVTCTVGVDSTVGCQSIYAELRNVPTDLILA